MKRSLIAAVCASGLLGCHTPDPDEVAFLTYVEQRIDLGSINDCHELGSVYDPRLRVTEGLSAYVDGVQCETQIADTAVVVLKVGQDRPVHVIWIWSPDGVALREAFARTKASAESKYGAGLVECPTPEPSIRWYLPGFYLTLTPEPRDSTLLLEAKPGRPNHPSPCPYGSNELTATPDRPSDSVSSTRR